ncbi:hypothetical protein AAFF_G00030570 [Aldrovandia affinis]|uniref:Band 7 domain-containing protein n=1 Tax=Aldrovandia affinis TaxID=143900 RepID=A0AAD7WFV7_9TELE|nr:hypothetical protein AAFF_G00030570 [Aldrovandia affinis]
MSEQKQIDREDGVSVSAATENIESGFGVCSWLLIILSVMLIIITLPFSIWTCIKTVKEYERSIVFRLGRILRGGVRGPGLFFILPCTDNFITVDMRTITFDIPLQEVLTKDSVTVSVEGVVYYRVKNATLAVTNINNADAATRLLAQTILRNVLGTKSLAELLSDREQIALSMELSLDETTESWGIKVERVEIKDVKLPQQLQKAMATEAEAAREARAKRPGCERAWEGSNRFHLGREGDSPLTRDAVSKEFDGAPPEQTFRRVDNQAVLAEPREEGPEVGQVITAYGEMNASRALREASMVIAESPAALQLRYLQTLNSIAAEKNSTIVFPLPMEMFPSFMRRSAEPNSYS